MDNRLILCCLVFLFTLLPVTAQSIDSDNVIITSAEETYTFSLESGNPVLHVRLSTEYEATKAGERIQVATYYGKYITIDKASAGSLFNKALYQQVIPENVFYDDTKVCFFNLYFDRKGKKAEVTFEKTYHDIRYFTSVYLPDIYFVKQKKINIIIPPGLNINLLEQNFSSNITVKKVLDAKTGNTIYTYFVTDQKPFKKEYSMPGRAFVYPHLLVLGAFISYHDLYHWLSGLVDTEDSSVVRQKALAITEGCLSEEQKIEAVYAWVQKNIRYIAFEDGESGHKPDRPSEVLRKGYGDCKGMSALLKAFLVALQFDARLCWMGTNEIATRFTDVPTLASGNHMICALFFGGKKYYLDATMRYLPLGYYPYHIQGQQVLIENGDSCIVDILPRSDVNQNTDSIHYEYSLENGRLSGVGREQLFGDLKCCFLFSYDALETSRRSEFLSSHFTLGKTVNKVTDIQLTGNDPQALALEIAFTIHNNSSCQQLDDEYYIELDPQLDSYTTQIDTLNRQHDFHMAFPYHYVCEVILKVPQGYKISHLPDPFVRKNKQGTFSLSYTKRANSVLYLREIRIHNPFIRRDDFVTWNKDVKQLMEAASEQIILIKDISK